ncbi:MAG: DUF3597 domain-containing protein [Anaerolineales bacterium]
MSVFGKILSNLGLRKEKEVATEPPKPAAGKDTAMADRIAKLRASRREQKLKEVTVVDVMGKLEKMAEENPAELNWKTSIVDLLKLLGIESSYEARRELAVELGCPEEKMDDSAEMNTWLHKAVLVEIAENGGNVPDELLD